MKEIDFLPEWYKSGKRREVSYRTQYIALIGVFLVMVVWSLVAKHTISKTRAQCAEIRAQQVQAESVSDKLDKLKSELVSLKIKAESLERIDSKIDVAGVLAELSFLVNPEIVLSKVEFLAEKFSDKQQADAPLPAGTVVRVVQAKHDKKQGLPLGDVRFKVVITGVAAEAGDVATLICELEDSPYFCQVVPSFSRNAEIDINGSTSLGSQTNYVEGIQKTTRTANRTRKNIQVSEFEINCYLANYSEGKR